MGAEGFRWISDLGIGLTQVARDGIQFDLGRVALPYRPEYAAEPEQTLKVTVSFTVGAGDNALGKPLSLERELDLYPIRSERVLNLWHEEERALSAIALIGLTDPAYNWRDKWPMGRAVFTHLRSDEVVRWGREVPAGTEVVLKVIRKVEGEESPASDFVAYVEDGLLPPEPSGAADVIANPEDPRPPLRDSEEIQGNVLAGFNKPHQEFLLFNFPEGAATRPVEWLRDLVLPRGEQPDAAPLITTTKVATEFKEKFKKWQAAQKQGGSAEDSPEPKPAVWWNISLTFAGLCRLQPGFQRVQEAGPDGIDLTAFRQGAADRAGQFGAVDNNGPDKWAFGGAGKLTVHAVVTIAADEKHDLDAERDRQVLLAEGHGIQELGRELSGGKLTGPAEGREHFGFREGISQPGVEGYSYPSEHPGSRIVASKHFVFGDRSAKWLRNGSMQVFEQLAQDVAAWREQVSSQSGRYSVEETMAPDLFAAKLVGRWPSGTPLALAPVRDYRASYTTGDNDFTYDNDDKGKRTPFCAHIRKQNPRDAGSDARRILRRGIPYGPPFEPGVVGRGADEDRGLLFNAFMADIEGQFEALQKEANNPAKQGPDALLGAPREPDRFQLPQVGVKKPRKFSLEEFVRVKGMIYAFAPSIPVLRALAENKAEELGLDGP